ncbi:MAG TPA: hypothetical protein EYQ61_04635 [Dehalococcoidia bacterium]|jgi:hypothetical protein|nr:hypothetical protein [Dehalococcoidia bacterium]HIK88975.1 hypothetical protein [Dehalococcoidia bacterium]
MLDRNDEIFSAYLEGLRSLGWNGSEADSKIGFWFAAGGYGTYLASFAAMVNAQFGGWEFIVQRFGDDADGLEASCFRRLEIVVDLVEEAASLV